MHRYQPPEKRLSTTQYRKLACQLLQADYCDWPKSASKAEFIAYAESQGILMLMQNQHEFIEENWPHEILKSVLIANAAGQHLEQNRLGVTTRLLNLCQKRKLEILLFKGAANTYLLYDKPHQRQHADIDALIRVEDYSIITDVLIESGFIIDPVYPTEFGPYQTTARLHSDDNPVVMIDVHWKINNRLLLADTLNFDELKQRSISINQYGDCVIGFGYADALLTACIHDAGSLPVERNKLIALYDAHLLMNKLGNQAVKDALQVARDKGIGTICFDYLNRAAKYFNAENQRQWLGEIEADFRNLSHETSARLLTPSPSWMSDQWLDYLAVKGSKTKSKYIINKLLRKLKN